jgi:hypothetical protein
MLVLMSGMLLVAGELVTTLAMPPSLVDRVPVEPPDPFWLQPASTRAARTVIASIGIIDFIFYCYVDCRRVNRKCSGGHFVHRLYGTNDFLAMGCNPTVSFPRRALVAGGKFRENCVAMPGEQKILFGDAAFIMRGELQRHLVEANVYFRMVVQLLRLLGDMIDEGNALPEAVELESAANDPRVVRPIGDSL